MPPRGISTWGTAARVPRDSRPGPGQTSNFHLGSTAQSGVAGGTGTLHLNGGTLSRAPRHNDHGTTGNLYFNGGTLQASGGSGNFLAGNGTLNAYVQTCGA